MVLTSSYYNKITWCKTKYNPRLKHILFFNSSRFLKDDLNGFQRIGSRKCVIGPHGENAIPALTRGIFFITI